MAIRIAAIEWARIEFDLAGETMSQAEYDRLKGKCANAVYIRKDDEGAEEDAAENWLPDGHPYCPTYGRSNCSTWPPVFMTRAR